MGWKGAQKSLVQTLLKPGSAVRSDQVAQDFVQPGLETSEDGDRTTSLGNLLHCLPVLGVKKVLLLSSLNLSFQLPPVVPHPPATHRCEKLGSVLLITSLQVTPQSLLFCKLNKPQPLSISPLVLRLGISTQMGRICPQGLL